RRQRDPADAGVFRPDARRAPHDRDHRRAAPAGRGTHPLPPRVDPDPRSRGGGRNRLRMLRGNARQCREDLSVFSFPPPTPCPPPPPQHPRPPPPPPPERRRRGRAATRRRARPPAASPPRPPPPPRP